MFDFMFGHVFEMGKIYEDHNYKIRAMVNITVAGMAWVKELGV